MSKARHILDLQGKFGTDGNLLPGLLPTIPPGLLPAVPTTPISSVKQVVSFEEAQQPSSDAALNEGNRWMSQGNGLSSPNYWPSVSPVRVNRIIYTNGVGANAFPGPTDSDYAHEPIWTVEKRTIGQTTRTTVFTAGGLNATTEATQVLTPIDLTLTATEEIGIRWTSGARPAQVHLELETTGTAGGSGIVADRLVPNANADRSLLDYDLGFLFVNPGSFEQDGFGYFPPFIMHSDYAPAGTGDLVWNGRYTSTDSFNLGDVDTNYTARYVPNLSEYRMLITHAIADSYIIGYRKET